MKNRILALSLATAAALALPAHAAFKCVDEKGRTYIGDTPPEACAKVVMYEVTRSGQVIRTIQPTLTEEQVKARIEEEERKKEADKAAFEQKRKDLALLATYSTESELDVARDRNIDPINSRIKLAQERIVDIDKRNKQLDEELEFYKAGKSGKSKNDDGKKNNTGTMLQEEQNRLKVEKAQVLKSIASSEKEITDLKAKFEVDKKRWIALKAGKAGPGAEAADAKVDAKPTEAKAEAKADAKPAPKAAPKKN